MKKDKISATEVIKVFRQLAREFNDVNYYKFVRMAVERIAIMRKHAAKEVTTEVNIPDAREPKDTTFQVPSGAQLTWDAIRAEESKQ